ncbi:hypothetical protein T02_6310 [Trichinella nativa]|uniref:Uncharacterized protein n=1 Tax=Trichinella nativa TaxID=6335 RepID=A0A0V1LPB2_9BILA|nr:hypothetical protein T06_15192 [Trichinella sp. T6]KRZ61309.1 hypothetical protein T02_6310 [Trichinella nativa]
MTTTFPFGRQFGENAKKSSNCVYMRIMELIFAYGRVEVLRKMLTSLSHLLDVDKKHDPYHR